MCFLHENYHLLSVDKLLGLIETGEPLPPRSVMVTFDDGYHDFLDTAWPILEQYQIPVIMFLVTSFLSGPRRLFWWDELYQGVYRTRRDQLCLPDGRVFPLAEKGKRWRSFLELKNLLNSTARRQVRPLMDAIMQALDVEPESGSLMMDWSDVRSLHARGCHMAAHTRNHVVLSHVSVEEGLQQIRGSQQDIQKELGSALPVFAYPSGHSRDLNDRLIPLLRQEGFKLAMSSLPGMNILPSCELLRLRRIGLSTRVSSPEFRLILTGIYHSFCTLRGDD
jgi:peptidoglycan/xylan/chitin deacetylase (PgdA/CDA1 family)